MSDDFYKALALHKRRHEENGDDDAGRSSKRARGNDWTPQVHGGQPRSSARRKKNKRGRGVIGGGSSLLPRVATVDGPAGWLRPVVPRWELCDSLDASLLSQSVGQIRLELPDDVSGLLESWAQQGTAVLAERRQRALVFWRCAVGCRLEAELFEGLRASGVLAAVDGRQEHFLLAPLSTPIGTYPSGVLRGADIRSMVLSWGHTSDAAAAVAGSSGSSHGGTVEQTQAATDASTDSGAAGN